MQFPPMSNNIVSWGKTECQRGHSQIEVGPRGLKEPSLICNFELDSHFVFFGCDRAAIHNPAFRAVGRSPERHLQTEMFPCDLICAIRDIYCPPMEVMFSVLCICHSVFSWTSLYNPYPSPCPSPASWDITPRTPLPATTPDIRCWTSCY